MTRYQDLLAAMHDAVMNGVNLLRRFDNLLFTVWLYSL
ncbi:portal protein [Salmonella phage 19]|nr:portal protein [Salmonella phage 19]